MNSSKMSSLAAGNKALRENKFRLSIQCYIQALQENKELERSIVSNIAYARLKLLCQRSELDIADESILIISCSDDPVVLIRANQLESIFKENKSRVDSKGNSIINDDVLCFPSVSTKILSDTIALNAQASDDYLDFVLANPYDRVVLCNPDEKSIGLGVFFKLIWFSQVIIDISNPLNRKNEFNIPALCHHFDLTVTHDLEMQMRYGGVLIKESKDLAMLLKSWSKVETPSVGILEFSEQKGGLIKTLSSIKDAVSFSQLVKINSSLVNSMFSEEFKALLNKLNATDLLHKSELFKNTCRYQNNKTYLDALYAFALGRSPEPHEVMHFGNQLEKNEVSRLGLAELVLTCEEGMRHLGDIVRENSQNKIKKTFQLPRRGEIQPEEIVLPKFNDPVVSVLIPVYGKVEYTLACLKSISENLPSVSFEILVLDDRSPDNSVVLLQKINNIRVIVNPQNLGFLRSCNNGAKHAKGKYLLFLNNDTQVKNGWMDELLRTFDCFPGCGLAGSKLIYPDGLLQEAGGILWKDGSAWNYGNRQDPSLPNFNYAREVDYVSGAAIMVPSLLYQNLGGFDDIYAPAYCEDSDLALKIRDAGYRVIYQPLSEIVHFEGVTSGTDTGQGVKAYQVKNSKTLFERWEKRLANHRPNGQEPEREKDRGCKMRALVIEHCTPTPDQDAGSVSVFNILLMLREMGFQTTFIPEDNFLYMPEYTTRLQRAGVEVIYSPHALSVEDHLKVYGDRYDLAFLFRPKVVEKHLDVIKKYCPHARTLFYTHDIHHLRIEREAELLHDTQKRAEAEVMKVSELSSIRSMDSTILVSTAELEILRPQLPGVNLEVLPLLLNIPGTKKGYKERKDFCFVGGFQHTPNVDAVQYFSTDVMPIVREILPGVKFHVVGSNPPDFIQKLACDDIVVHGFIEDLNGFLDQMRLSVAPLRYGAGVKGKVGTALAAGLPSVLSEIAAEGMALTPEEHALISNDAKGIAMSIQRLYSNQNLWEKLSRQGIVYAEKAWGPDASYFSLMEIIKSLFPGFSSKPEHKLSLYSEKFS